MVGALPRQRKVTRHAHFFYRVRAGSLQEVLPETGPGSGPTRSGYQIRGPACRTASAACAAYVWKFF